VLAIIPSDEKLKIIERWCQTCHTRTKRSSGEYYITVEYKSFVSGGYMIRSTRDHLQLHKAIDEAYRIVMKNVWELVLCL